MTNKTLEIDGEVFEMVTTHDLHIGDVIYCQGCLMELRTRNERADEINGNAFGNVVWLRGFPITENLGAIPASWMEREDGFDGTGDKYWLVQGNGRASWLRRVYRTESEAPARFQMYQGPDGETRLRRA